MRGAVLLTTAVLALGGCGVVGGKDPAPHPDVTADDATVALVDQTEADLVLIVSNQSFDDAHARLTVTVDGATVVDDDFHVEDQHNWTSFPLRLPPGRHEVVADSDSGATLRKTFEVPRDTTRYAIIDHWSEDDSADLTWQLLRREPAFG